VRVYRLRLFGREIASFEVEFDSAEVLASAIAELTEDNTDNFTEDPPLPILVDHLEEHTVFEPLRWQADD